MHGLERGGVKVGVRVTIGDTKMSPRGRLCSHRTDYRSRVKFHVSWYFGDGLGVMVYGSRFI